MLTIRLNRLGLSPGARVLDLGCGEGRHVHGLYMEDGLDIVGLDIHEPSLQKAREGLALLKSGKTSSKAIFMRGNALALPFEADSFDAVICSEVLEHIEPFHKVLAEIRRVLKPDGIFAASVPRAGPERLCWKLAPPPNGYAFEPGGHIRIFDETELQISVQRHGFSYSGKHYAHGLHLPYWWLKCLYWKREPEPMIVRLYHRLLVWDLLKRPFFTRALGALLNPFIGKSVAMYFGPEARK